MIKPQAFEPPAEQLVVARSSQFDPLQCASRETVAAARTPEAFSEKQTGSSQGFQVLTVALTDDSAQAVPLRMVRAFNAWLFCAREKL